ncbi:unnamed protein product, partial [Pylaiella littoralis]
PVCNLPKPRIFVYLAVCVEVDLIFWGGKTPSLHSENFIPQILRHAEMTQPEVIIPGTARGEGSRRRSVQQLPSCYKKKNSPEGGEARGRRSRRPRDNPIH